MKITKQLVINKILDYLNRKITLQEIVDWAEEIMQEGEIANQNSNLIRDSIAQIGLADIRQFGLSWDDIYTILASLGCKIKIKVA